MMTAGEGCLEELKSTDELEYDRGLEVF